METFKLVTYFLLAFALCNERTAGQRTGSQVFQSRAALLQRARECVNSSTEISGFHKETRQCYKVWSTGPCGEHSNMIFLMESAEEGELYGSCQCKDSDRVTAYYPPHKTCYSVYDQGYCRRGYMLTPVKKGSSEIGCRPNSCFQPFRPGLIKFEDRCVKIGASCDTGVNDDHGDGIIRVDEDDGSTLFCGIPTYSGGAGAITVNCPRGSYRTRAQTCKRIIFRADNW